MEEYKIIILHYILLHKFIFILLILIIYFSQN